MNIIDACLFSTSILAVDNTTAIVRNSRKNSDKKKYIGTFDLVVTDLK